MARLSVYMADNKKYILDTVVDNNVDEYILTSSIFNSVQIPCTCSKHPKLGQSKLIYVTQMDVCPNDNNIYDCVYDDDSLGFEKCLMTEEKETIKVQDPLEEINLGSLPIYISNLLHGKYKEVLTTLLHEYKY